jgi:hypothetical protein
MTPSSATETPAASIAGPPEFRWQGRVPAGRSIEVKGVIGDVRALPATGDRVEVVAIRRQGARGDAAAVELRVVEHDGGVTICAVYPSPAGSPPNGCTPGGGLERMHVENNDVRVEFTVRVPAGVGFVGRNVDGAVRAAGLRGPVTAVTVAGEIRLELEGARGRQEARSVGGDVVVAFARDGAAQVEASTVGGKVESDFPLDLRGGLLGKRARGAIGAGGPELRIQTVGGDIRLVRG